MTCRFFFNDAPNTVMNFVRLSKEGFYNNLTFHRIVKGFMIQAGCPKGDGTGSPGHCIKAEFNQNKHLKGVLSMARSQHNDSAGSQFFICHGTTSNLDGKYTAFGQLIEGLDVLDTIANTSTVANPAMPGETSKPGETITIKKITLGFKEK
jgi:cyclophilin family peptidyl-prolyl cis-trans isomerase